MKTWPRRRGPTRWSGARTWPPAPWWPTAAPRPCTPRAGDKLKIDRVVVPGGAGVGSAIGFLLAPVSYEVVRSRYMRLSRLDAQAANAVMAEMYAEADAVVAAAPAGDRQESRRAFMRYVGQGYEIAVPVPVETLTEGHAERCAGVRCRLSAPVRAADSRPGCGNSQLDADPDADRLGDRPATGRSAAPGRVRRSGGASRARSSACVRPAGPVRRRTPALSSATSWRRAIRSRPRAGGGGADHHRGQRGVRRPRRRPWHLILHRRGVAHGP